MTESQKIINCEINHAIDVVNEPKVGCHVVNEPKVGCHVTNGLKFGLDVERRIVSELGKS